MGGFEIIMSFPKFDGNLSQPSHDCRWERINMYSICIQNHIDPYPMDGVVLVRLRLRKYQNVGPRILTLHDLPFRDSRDRIGHAGWLGPLCSFRAPCRAAFHSHAAQAWEGGALERKPLLNRLENCYALLQTDLDC